jgi:hypothetical protein
MAIDMWSVNHVLDVLLCLLIQSVISQDDRIIS